MASSAVVLLPTPRANRFALSTAIFLRALAIIHLIAFVSFWTQLPGLIGPHGILPAADYLAAARAQLGSAAFFRLPTLCWLFGATTFLHVLCAAGVVLSLLLFFGVAPVAALALLWSAYLSLVNVGQIFLGFQWDALLLETTLLAIFVAPRSLLPRWRPVEPPRLAHLLLLWLLFRLMFLSGVVKLSSGDPTWRALTALTFHYETQPLPNPLAWFLHQLPATAHRAACAGMFVIELAVPFLLFAPRALRHLAAVLLAAFQLAILLSGNFAFFNLLTIALCLLALDDALWIAVLRKCHLLNDTSPLLSSESPKAQCHLIDDTPGAASVVGRWLRRLGFVAAAGVLVYTALFALLSSSRGRWSAWFSPVVNVVAPFASLNNYGLFAVMTTSRPELIIEGSDDAQHWLAYELPYKPGDLSRSPPIVAPHQPRLDWQLWFAALGSADDNRWVLQLGERLLRGAPEVLALFSTNPFPRHPPRYLRVVRYDYRFTTAAERAATGHWWRRTPLDFYVEPVSLR